MDEWLKCIWWKSRSITTRPRRAEGQAWDAQVRHILYACCSRPIDWQGLIGHAPFFVGQTTRRTTFGALLLGFYSGFFDGPSYNSFMVKYYGTIE
jgi:hypothetical protein